MVLTLEVSSLACVRGGAAVFSDVSFRLAGGTAMTIRGPNGSGKSSLLRLIGGLMRPTRGAILLDHGKGPQAMDERSRHSHLIGHKLGITDAMSAVGNLRFQTGLLGGDLSRVESALDRLGLQSFAHQRAGLLSAGQRRRLALARLMSAPRPLWLLDEPMESLDAAGETLVQSMLSEHCASGGMALIATHGIAPRAARFELSLVPVEKAAA